MQRVKDKIALVTGGASGIGKAISLVLAEQGATVIIADIQDDSGLALAKEIGKQSLFLHLDVSKEKDWQTVTQTLRERFGKIDILVNNAGIGFSPDLGSQDPEHASLESWHRIHAINLDGVFLGCKYGIALMKAHGGAIINISSTSGIIGQSLAAAYASSKAAVRNHTKTVALYCAEKSYNIRCNSIHPGPILTPMWRFTLGEDASEQKQIIAAVSNSIPLKTMGDPTDVAQAVLYLASDESKYVTGTELVIDGGILAGLPSSAYSQPSE